jgi:cobalamin-dependent methionine synthase I
MIRHVLDDISFSINPESLAKHVKIKKETEYFKTLYDLVQDAEKIARPKALYKPAFIETKGDDQVVIEETIFKSRILKVNLENIYRVFIFVATCGREIDQWSKSIGGVLDRFIADAIKIFAMQTAVKAMDEHIRENYDIIKKSRMTPGSLKDWPITEQRAVFKLLGDVEGDIGVCLMDSLMMDPVQSISGIIFPTETSFESCQLCPRENCPGRRAAYDKNLYEKKYKPKAG